MDLRVIKTKELLYRTFFKCLEETDFTEMTVKSITETARINRSTFYRYFTDKYDMRDQIVDAVVKDFAENLECGFLDKKNLTLETYYDELKQCLEFFRTKKKEYLILWESVSLGRNVFEEMINLGMIKIRNSILACPDINEEKKQFAELYARLFLNSMMVSVRWWFIDGEHVSLEAYTKIMIRHMSESWFYTLKSNEPIQAQK